MEDFLKKGAFVDMMIAFAFLVTGVLMFSNSALVIDVVTHVIEAVLVVLGLSTIINYIRLEMENDFFTFGFAYGVVCILLSVFLIINAHVAITIIPVILGAWMLFGSLTHLQIIVKLKRFGYGISGLYILAISLMFFMGIFCMINPFAATAFVVKVLGAVIIGYSLIDIIGCIGLIGLVKSK